MYQFKANSKIFTNRETSSVALYLSDVSREPMISIDEETELASKIRRGGAEAEKAKNRLVRANLRFVVSVAKAYQYTGMALEDLISEGNIGLMKAADMFDATRGFKFISYAVWWIRQSITQALSENGRMVRLPVNQQHILNKIEKIFNRIQLEEGRIPTDEEVAMAVGITSDKVAKIRNCNSHPTSIDAPVLEDSESSMSDLMTSPDVPDTDSELMRESLRNEIENSMTMLSERERRILSMFFGLSGTEMSCGEIAARMSLTSERVRQLKERALKRLREKMSRKLVVA